MKIPIIAALAALAFAASASAQTSEESQESTLTLAHAREIALSGNPALAATTARAAAAEGAEMQAGTLPNPELTVDMEGFGGQLPGTREAETVLALSQTVETAGKRRLRTAVAAAETRSAAFASQAARLDLIAAVDSRFAAFLAAQERVTLAREALATATQVSLAVTALVDAGEVAPIERLRAESEQALAALDHQGARRDVDTARANLAVLLGRRPDEVPAAAGELPMPGDGLPATDASPGIEALPDLAQLRASVESAAAEHALARSERVPDLTLTLGGVRRNELDRTGFVAGVGVTLPLFDRRRGAIAAASAHLDALRNDVRAQELLLSSRLATARAAHAQANEEAATLVREVVPRTEKVFDALAEGYRRGKLPLLDLLQARRDLTAARGRLVEARLRLAETGAELDRLTGVWVTATPGENP